MIDERALERIRERSAQLGRKLTAQELIEAISEPEPDDHGDVEIVYDEGQCPTESTSNIS